MVTRLYCHEAEALEYSKLEGVAPMQSLKEFKFAFETVHF